MDYKERIRKLLALAKSPEENEAKAALLKARALMAKHKLTEAEFAEVQTRTVKKCVTSATFSMRRCPWINDLALIIGESYCCQAYLQHLKGKRTYTVGFVGLEDDIEICLPIFRYALDCVMSKNKRTRKEWEGYPARYVNSRCDGYGYGFVSGLRKAFDQQKAEHSTEWGLVLATPKEVTDAIKGFGQIDLRSQSSGQIDYREYQTGFADGRKFDPTKRIGKIDGSEAAL